MTDTTDIKALRERLAIEANRVRDQRYVDENCCVVNKRDLLTTVELLDKLEAERQRVGTRIAELEERLRYTEESLIAVNDLLTEAEARVKELEALKGDRVPVAYIADCGTIIGDCDPFFDDYKNPRPLFTAPQKPVVHPDTKRMDWLCAHCVEVRDPQMYGSHAMFHAQQDSEEWDLPHHTTLREQVDAAIEAAGGIVSTSDERLMQDMSSIVKDGE